MYYINIRDIKSKITSLEEIVREMKPTVIAITETWLEPDSPIEIEGYAVYRNDRDENGGGVMIAVKKELKNITTEIKRTKENLESMFIMINNSQIKLRLGVVYFPQEKDQKLKEIYNIIKEQVERSRNEEESIIIIGDFNCRIGNEIEGNDERVTKGGKKMLQFVEKEDLKIINCKESSQGLWTREENGTRSILDCDSR